MSGNFIFTFDANLIYSKDLRDLLVRLALAGLFRAKWTTEILNEMREGYEKPPLTADELLEVFTRNGLARTADALSNYISIL